MLNTLTLGPTITVKSSVPAASFTAWSTITEICGLVATIVQMVSLSSPVG